jgi:DNA-binding NarL/FixJ family response regulator
LRHLVSLAPLPDCPKEDTLFAQVWCIDVLTFLLLGGFLPEVGVGLLRLLIADDHPILRRGLRCLLEAQSGWQVVAEAADGREAVAKAQDTRPDLAVLDIGMPVLNGLEAAQEIVQNNPRTKIVMLTVHDSDAMIHKVLASGARGYVFKTDAARDLVNAVNEVQADKTFFTGNVEEILLRGFINSGRRPRVEEPLAGRLTLRQREIIQLLAEGRSTKEVATLLNVSVKTAETHRSNIMRRINCRSAAQLVRYALRNQIIEA